MPKVGTYLQEDMSVVCSKDQDPLIDPWKAALESSEHTGNRTSDATHAGPIGSAYSLDGGVNLFANKKRLGLHTCEQPNKKRSLSHHTSASVENPGDSAKH